MSSAPGNRWFLPLFSELTVTNIAFFAGLTVLVIHIVGTLKFSPAETSLVLIASSVGLRFSRIALAPFIDRISPRKVIPAAILLSMAGYLGMTAAVTPGAVALCVLMIGTGYGINGMLVTTLASYAAPSGKSAFPMYALMNSGTNFAAVLAPLIANWLRLDVAPEAPFLFAAAVLGASFLISLTIRADVPATYRAKRFGPAAMALLKQPEFLVTLALIALGWAVYVQKFAVTPLFINETLNQPLYVGLAVTVNALIVLLISIPLGKFIRQRGVTGHKVLAAGFLLYALAYALLAVRTEALWFSLAVWSLGEALLMPQLNALIAEHTGPEERLAGFSLAAAAIGIGEASGNAAGVWLFGAGASAAYAVFACLAALVCAGVMIWFVKYSPREGFAS